MKEIDLISSKSNRVFDVEQQAASDDGVCVSVEGGGREFQLYVSVSFLINFFHKLGSVSIA